MNWIDEALDQQRALYLLRTPVPLQPISGTRAQLADREVLVFCSNDYLGLRTDPRLVAAAQTAAARYGTGFGASRLVSGHSDLHHETEQQLAQLVERPAALLSTSGFAANLGTLAALLGREDVVFSDSLNHASIIDGCRLSGARIAVYPHAQPDALRSIVEGQRPFRRGWVVTESVFSMDGDLAPLAELRAYCDSEGLQLYVDDAHALGHWGPQGQGAASAIATDVLVGTLGKALGTTGGFVAGSSSLQLYLWNRCRSFVFSTAASPMVVAAASEATRIVRNATTLRTRLHANLDRLRNGLRHRGVPAGGHPRAPIVPLVVGSETRAVALSQRLLERGIFVQAIRPPTVPANTARLRITISAAHSTDDIDQLVDALARCI